jgi:stage V sporulation protein B
MLNKIKNNKFAMSTIILLIGGILTKALGFFLKIIINRNISYKTLGLFSLLSPTNNILTILAIMSYPTSISKLIANKKYNSKNIILSLIPFSLLINSIIIFIIIFISSFLSNTLLKETSLKVPIICISLVLPFISFSSIIKGYFWGKQRMLPYMISNILEQILRVVIILLLLPKTLKISVTTTICMIILVNIISESFSILIMLLFIPKIKIKLSDFIPSFNIIKDILKISIPSTTSKIVGSICYFFEPIILTNTLLYIGYSKNFILKEYGILNGYALPLLLLPQFLTQSMATALVPEIAKLNKINNKIKIKNRIILISIISLLIGLISTIIIYIYPELLLNILFKKTEGANYIRALAPFTLLYYLELPFISAMQALDKAKECMNITLISSIIKLFSIFIFSFILPGMYGLVLSIILSLIITTYLNYRSLNKELN